MSQTRYKEINMKTRKEKKMEQKTQQQRRLKNRRIDLSSWCEHPFLLKIVLRVVNIPFYFIFENNFVLKASNFRINLAFSAVPQKQFSNYNEVIKVYMTEKFFSRFDTYTKRF